MRVQSDEACVVQILSAENCVRLGSWGFAVSVPIAHIRDFSLARCTVQRGLPVEPFHSPQFQGRAIRILSPMSCFGPSCIRTCHFRVHLNGFLYPSRKVLATSRPELVQTGRNRTNRSLALMPGAFVSIFNSLCAPKGSVFHQ